MKTKHLPKNHLRLFWSIVSLLVLLSGPVITFAQESTLAVIDSLQLRYDTSDPEDRIDILNELAFQFLFVDVPQAKIHADRALKLAIEEEYDTGMADAESRLASYFRLTGDLDSSLVHHYACLAVRQTLGKPNLVANTYHNIATILDISGLYDSAISVFEKVLGIYAKDEAFLADMAGTYNSMSEVYKNKKDYKQALIFCQQGLEIRRNLNEFDSQGIANGLINLGAIYTEMGKYDNASAEYSDALVYLDQLGDLSGQEKVHLNMGVNYAKQGKLEEATIHYEAAIDLSKQTKNVEERSHRLLNLGALYIRQEAYDKAKNHLLAAIPLAEDEGNYSLLSLCWNSLAQAEFGLENYDRALLCYHKSLESAEDLGASLTRGKIYEGIARTYTKMAKYDSANVYYQLNNKIRDSLFSVDRTTLELDKQLNVAKAEGHRKTAELNVVQLQSANQSIIIIALSIVVLLLALLLYYFWQVSKEKQKVIEAENKDLLRKKEIDDLIRLQEEQSIQRLVEGQEEERERISAELHSRLGSLLSSLKWNIDSFKEPKTVDSQENKPSISQLNTLVDETIQEMRNISHNMTSGILKDFGLESAIENLVNTFNGKGIIIELFVHKFDQRLDQFTELGLYRIAQEAIANALKHAEATEINIQLNRFEDRINLLIEDNGKGFDPEIALKKKGRGLKNIEFRAKQLGVEAEIESRPGRGTTISIDVPLDTQDTSTDE